MACTVTPVREGSGQAMFFAEKCSRKRTRAEKILLDTGGEDFAVDALILLWYCISKVAKGLFFLREKPGRQVLPAESFLPDGRGK